MTLAVSPSISALGWVGRFLFGVSCPNMMYTGIVHTNKGS